MSESLIKHRTERIPDIARSEIYEFEDMVYTEMFDDVTGARMFGHVTMYNGIRVCSVHEDGTITMDMPTNWVTCHNDMVALSVDVQRLDFFITAVCNNYH